MSTTDRTRRRRGPEVSRERWAAAARIDRLAVEAPDLVSLMGEAVQLAAAALPVPAVGIFELTAGGQELRLVAGVGERLASAADLRVTAREAPQTFQGLAAGQPLVVRSQWRGGLWSRLRAHDGGELLEVVSAVIPGRDGPYGALIALDGARRALPEADLDFLQGIANVLSMAVARDRAERMHRQAEELLRALNDVARAILEGRDPTATLRLIAWHARRLVDADLAAVVTEAPEPDSMVIAVADGALAQELEGTFFPKAGSLAGRVVGEGSPVVADDLSKEEAERRRRVWAGRAGPAVFVALAAQGRTRGALVVANRVGGRRLGERELRVVETFARQAAIALEQGRGRQALEELAVLEDRGRIARELHDGVIQALFGIGMSLQATSAAAERPDLVRARLDREAAAIDRVIADVRNYIFDMRPAILAEQRLAEALSLLARGFEDRYRVPVTLELDGGAASRLEGRASEVIQITREALSNVGRHAGASACRLALAPAGSGVVLTVADDGAGFAAGRAASGGGLENMRHRSSRLGARLHLDSQPGRGTTVRVVFPASGRS